MGMGIQGISHAQTTSTPQLIKQWNVFNYPSGVAVDSQGNVYVADTNNNAVREIYCNGTVKTLNNTFNNPFGVAVDSLGNVYVADSDNNAVEEIYSNGTVKTLNSTFNHPFGVALIPWVTYT